MEHWKFYLYFLVIFLTFTVPAFRLNRFSKNAIIHPQIFLAEHQHVQEGTAVRVYTEKEYKRGRINTNDEAVYGDKIPVSGLHPFL